MQTRKTVARDADFPDFDIEYLSNQMTINIKFSVLEFAGQGLQHISFQRKSKNMIFQTALP